MFYLRCVMFNDHFVPHEDDPRWLPAPHSPEHLAQIALCVKLQSRLVLFEGQSDKLNAATAMTSTTLLWDTPQLDAAITEAKTLLKDQQAI